MHKKKAYWGLLSKPLESVDEMKKYVLKRADSKFALEWFGMGGWTRETTNGELTRRFYEDCDDILGRMVLGFIRDLCSRVYYLVH